MPQLAPGAGIAAAGFAVARMLAAAPDQGLLERFADVAGRRSWPVRNGPSLTGLRLIARGFHPEQVRSEWVQLFGDTPGAITLRESSWLGTDPGTLEAELVDWYHAAGTTSDHLGKHPLDHLSVELAHLAQLSALHGRAETSADRDTAEGCRQLIGTFRTDHVDPYWRAVATEIGDRAGTTVLLALPDLLAGFMGALEGLRFPTEHPGTD